MPDSVDPGGGPPRPFLRIVRVPYEEPYHLDLIVTMSNGRSRAALEIYTTPEDLRAAADRLAGFPANARDEFVWEIGSERPEDRFAYHFRLRAWCLAPTGHCALELHTNNNQAPAAREVAEFSLGAHPADLDRLAALLAGFARLEHRVLEWTVTDGALLDPRR